MPASQVVSDDIRKLTGLGTQEINDATINGLIEQAENMVESQLNLTPGVRLAAETYTTQPRNTGIKLDHKPVLRVRELRDGDTTISPSNIVINREPGIIQYTKDADLHHTNPNHEQANLRVKYEYGEVEPDPSVQVEANEASTITSGNSVSIQTTTELEVKDGDYIEISGLQSPTEAAKITSQTTNSVTVDKLLYDHDQDSLLTQVQTKPKLNELVRVTAAINVLIREAHGKDNTVQNYNLGDLNVSNKSQDFNTSIDTLVEQQQTLVNELRQPVVA